MYHLSINILCAIISSITTIDGTKVANTRLDSAVVSSTHPYDDRLSPFGLSLINLRSTSLAESIPYEEAMKLLPSVDVRERGGKSVQADVAVRGGNSDQTAILLNGIDFTDIRTGHQSHSLPVDSDIISQIRLIDGSNRGLTGALNLMTAPLRENYLRANLSGGMYGYAYGNLSGNITRRKSGNEMQLFNAASFKRSDGYIHNTDFENFNFYSRFQYSSGKAGRFDAQAGYQNRAFGANGFYSLKYPDQYEQTSTLLGSLRWTMDRDAYAIDSYISYRRNTDRFELIKGSEDKVPFNHHLTDNFAAYASASFPWIAGRSLISAEYRFGGIRSSVLGDPLPQAMGKYTRHKERHTLNMVLRHVKQWSRLELNAAVEGQLSPYGFTPIWNARVNYRPSDAWSLELTGARTHRLPTYTDLYYTATGYVSNPDLVPETATMVLGRAAYSKGIWAAELTAYYRHGKNIIDWIRENENSDWMSMQLTRMNTFGTELSLSLTPDHGILQKFALMGGYTDCGKDSGAYISKYVMDNIRSKACALAAFRFGKHWAFNTNAGFYDRAGAYEPYFLLNASISYTVGILKIYVNADNLTNTRYFDFTGLQMPGTWAVGGITICL